MNQSSERETVEQMKRRGHTEEVARQAGISLEEYESSAHTPQETTEVEDTATPHDTFVHFLMGVHGFTKQDEPEATQTCIDEAIVWFDSLLISERTRCREEFVSSAIDSLYDIWHKHCSEKSIAFPLTEVREALNK